MLRRYTIGPISPTIQYYLLRQNPEMGIKGTDAQTQSKIVILIAKLLELVEAAFPKGTHLYLSTLATDDSVCPGIRGSRYVKALESQITGQ